MTAFEVGSTWWCSEMSSRKVGGGINQFVVRVIDTAPGRFAFNGLVLTEIVHGTRADPKGKRVWIREEDLGRRWHRWTGE